MTKEDFIWFAGFYDAEGTVEKNRISISQNDKAKNLLNKKDNNHIIYYILIEVHI